ncbi:MAG: HAMP domain-containing sensor histidine kinase [Pseudomonadota bacterium]
MRTSIALLGAMLLTMLVLAGSTFELLKGQRLLLTQATRESQAQAAALLAGSIEQALIGAMRLPFQKLSNIPVDQIARARLQQVAREYPEIKEILLLGADMRVRQGFPTPSTPEQRVLVQWMADRAALEFVKNRDGGSSWHIAAEQIDGQSLLFAVQRINEWDQAEGWILMHFDLPAMFARHIQPLLNEFNAHQAGTATLAGPEAPWDDDALNWPVTRALPGWTVVVQPDSGRAAEHLRREQILILILTAALIVMLLMATFAVWRELRREHSIVALRNRFVANVSHELKTPLALIRMYAETLYLRRLTDPEKQHEYHRTILRESERLSAMIDNVLDFSRHQHLGEPYRLDERDLRETVLNTIADYRRHVEEQGLSVCVDCDPALPPVAHDRGGVRQIVLNLLDNAVKFGKEGGRIDIALHAKEGAVELSIADYGPGIPEVERERVRRPFERGRHPSAANGSGLGLAVVEQIAQAHHAGFRLEGVPGRQGLRAVVVFPVKEMTAT